LVEAKVGGRRYSAAGGTLFCSSTMLLEDSQAQRAPEVRYLVQLGGFEPPTSWSTVSLLLPTSS